MKHITLEEMFARLIEEIVCPNGKHTHFFWKDSDGYYEEIIDVDIMNGDFRTGNGYRSEYKQELDESHIYMME